MTVRFGSKTIGTKTVSTNGYGTLTFVVPASTGGYYAVSGSGSLSTFPLELAGASCGRRAGRRVTFLLESLTLLSEYRGAGIADGLRSIAWRLTFRHPERTLRDREVAGRRDKVVRTLEEELGVRQRTT